MNPIQQPKFEESPEAQEYIQKLQQGREQLAEAASPLEREAFDQLSKLQRSLFEQNSKRDQAAKQITSLEGEVATLGRNLDTTQGQMAAYAQMLVSAEAARREASAAPPIETVSEADLTPEQKDTLEKIDAESVEPEPESVEPEPESVEPEPESVEPESAGEVTPIKKKVTKKVTKKAAPKQATG